MITTNEEIHGQIHVKTIKVGWVKRSYQFFDGTNVIAQLDYANSFKKEATATVDNKQFSIRRRGFWTHHLEITSISHQPYNMKIDVSWRNKMQITDAGGNPFVFKSTSLWKNKWSWFDRYERPLIEIRSRILSRKNRGLVDIKYAEMKDIIFWVLVSWFVILCSESDAAASA